MKALGHVDLKFFSFSINMGKSRRTRIGGMLSWLLGKGKPAASQQAASQPVASQQAASQQAASQQAASQQAASQSATKWTLFGDKKCETFCLADELREISKEIAEDIFYDYIKNKKTDDLDHGYIVQKIRESCPRLSYNYFRKCEGKGTRKRFTGYQTVSEPVTLQKLEFQEMVPAVLFGIIESIGTAQDVSTDPRDTRGNLYTRILAMPIVADYDKLLREQRQHPFKGGLLRKTKRDRARRR
jgi:hypothetical protein